MTIPTRDELSAHIQGVVSCTALGAYAIRGRRNEHRAAILAAFDALEARIADDELRMAGKQSAIREKNARIAELESDLLFCVNSGDDLILDRDHWKAYARSLEEGYEQQTGNP